jgi:hypothetical protein
LKLHWSSTHRRLLAVIIRLSGADPRRDGRVDDSFPWICACALPVDLYPRAVAGFFVTAQPDRVLRGSPVSARGWLEAGMPVDAVVQLTPEIQVRAGIESLRADRMCRRLRKLGVLDALRFLELRSIFRRWPDAGGPDFESIEQCDAANYPTMMAVAAAALAPAYLNTLLDPTRTFASAQDHLGTTVEKYIQFNPGIVTDGLWLFFRRAFLTVREQCGENKRSDRCRSTFDAGPGVSTSNHRPSRSPARALQAVP